MKNLSTILLASLLILAVSISSTSASWLIYHKPEFKGKVIDEETKQPIEGLVVVAMYQTHTLVSGPGGGHSSIIHVKEVLTDKTGIFFIPSYTTFIQPNSTEDRVDCVMYKPGYGYYPNLAVRPRPTIGIEKLCSQEIGAKGELRIESIRGTKIIPVTYGIVELPLLNTWKERLACHPSRSSDLTEDKLPILTGMLKKEREWIEHNRKWKRYDSKSAIISAAREGDLEMTRRVIASGCDVNYLSVFGPAILESARGGYTEIARLLLDSGADVNLRGSYERTALMEAAKEGHNDLVGILLSRGAEVNAFDGNRRTSLMEAASNGHLASTVLLLKAGADPNAVNHDQESVLMLAASGKKHSLEIAKALIGSGANVNYIAQKGTIRTPFVKWVTHGDPMVVREFIKAGVELHSDYANEALIMAAGSAREETVRELLNSGVDVNGTYHPSGQTALMSACGTRDENVEVVQMLLSAGANVNAKNQDGVTPLMIAAGRGHANVVRDLLEAGADIEAKDQKGRTARALAEEYRKHSVIQILKDYR